MKHLFIPGILLGALASSLGGDIASATEVTVPFPTAGDAYCSATSGCGTIPSGGQTGFQWTTGDYVQSAIFTVPTSSVTDLTADWSYQDFLIGGNTETWNINVNGITVGQAVLPNDFGMGDILTFTGAFDFSDITPVAGGYQVELILQNTIPAGGGSVAWQDGGATGLSFVPEPSSLLLLASAALGFLGVRLPHRGGGKSL